jgi:hypothetical protein
MVKSIAFAADASRLARVAVQLPTSRMRLSSRLPAGRLDRAHRRRSHGQALTRSQCGLAAHSTAVFASALGHEKSALARLIIEGGALDSLSVDVSTELASKSCIRDFNEER